MTSELALLVNTIIVAPGTPCTLHPTPSTLRHTLYALHPAPWHHTPYTLHPDPLRLGRLAGKRIEARGAVIWGGGMLGGKGG